MIFIRFIDQQLEGIRMFSTVDSEIVKFDIVQALVIERIFQLVLNIVQRNQDKLADQKNKVGNPTSFFRSNTVNNGRSINQREDINEYQAISF